MSHNGGGLRESEVWRWVGTGIVRRRRRWKSEGILVVSKKEAGVRSTEQLARSLAGWLAGWRRRM